MIVQSGSPGRSPRQVFGGMVRFHRERAGLSRPETARQICKSVSLLQAIELGQRTATVEVTRDLESALHAEGALVQLRGEMAEALGYQAFPAWFQDWAIKEAEATTLRWHEPLIVPGLLQTEDYARAIFATRFRITEDETEELAAARMKRQEILARAYPPMFRVMLDEAVLRRQVGTRHVMCGQMNRLADAARQPHVAVEVIPASACAHIGLTGAFIIADFEDAPGVAYVESALRGFPVEDPKDVAALDVIWDTLRGEALPRPASLALLEEAAKSWSQQQTA
jgi:transcriptional regulator with XRE-family HTH domain